MSAHSRHLLHPPAMAPKTAAAKAAAAKAAARGWQEAAAGKRAPKGEHKAERINLSKMVGFLRYHSEEAKRKPAKGNPAKRNAAKEALEIYRTLSDPSTRLSFLSNFQEAGSGKNADALKFAFEFRQTLSSTKKIDVGCTEDFWTRHGANSIRGGYTQYLLSRRKVNTSITSCRGGCATKY